MERINSVLSSVEIDGSLAYGLERQMRQTKLLDESQKLFLIDSSIEKNQPVNTHYMADLKSATNVGRLAWCSDISLEGICDNRVNSLKFFEHRFALYSFHVENFC